MVLLSVNFRKQLATYIHHLRDIPSFHVVSVRQKIIVCCTWWNPDPRCVSRWLKRKAWILVGDGAYARMALAKSCVKSGATLISRLRLDAQLYESPEVKKKEHAEEIE